MRDFIYKALKESLNNESVTLEEKLPFELSRAYKNYKNDINNQASYEDKASIPKLSKIRGEATHDLGKADYKEISEEEALQLIKDKPNLNSNLSKMIFLFNLGDEYPESERYKIVRYNDEGNQTIRIDFEKYNDNIYYENKSGKRIYKTSAWPLKYLISLSNKIYLTNDKDLKFNYDDLSANPEANLEDKELKYKSGYYSSSRPFSALDSKGQPYLKSSNPVVNKKYLRNYGYGEVDTGSHYVQVGLKKYLKYSKDYYTIRYRDCLRRIDNFKKKYGEDISSYSGSTLNEYDMLSKRAASYLESATKEFLRQQRNRDEEKYPHYKNLSYDKFITQANVERLKSIKFSLDNMEKEIDNIKSENIYYNNYSSAMNNLYNLNRKKENLKKQLEDIEKEITNVDNTYTQEEKKEYELNIEGKIDSLLDKYEKYAEEFSEMKKKYLKENMEDTLNYKGKLDKEDINLLIKDEEEAIEGYQKALTKTTCDYEIEILNHIIDEEKEHIKELKSLLDGKKSYAIEDKNQKTKDTYMYKGPIYRFNKIISYEWEGTTKAISEKQALNNLRYQAGEYLGLDVGSHRVKIDLDPQFLTKIEDEESYLDDIVIDNNNEKLFCDECGTQLTDGGYCPKCDDGEENY